jgi:hypothetical protein
MGVREALDGGDLGVRLSLPGSVSTLQETPSAALLRDPERRVAWEIGHFPFRLDLRASSEEELRRDLEAEAREAFRTSYEQIAAEVNTEGRPPPRIRDGAWSPIIELERVEIGGARALRVIHRLTYEPTHELIVGRVLIPLASGVFEIAASHLARTTGYRESIRYATVSSGKQVEDPLAAARALTQKDFDDPTYDILFADHPLSLVRAALRWLEEKEGGALQVSSPMPEQEAFAVELAGAGCTITPPPRYLPLPVGAVPMSPTLSMLTRVGLSASHPRLLDVWRLPDEHIAGPDRLEALLGLARRNAQEWAGEGAADIEVKVSKLPEEDGRAHVRSQIQFKAQGRPVQTVARWFADRDGVVFRVSAGAGPWVLKKELQGDTDAVVRSLRRLDAPEEQPKGRRKWWPFG